MIFAIRRCRASSRSRPRDSVTSASGTTAAARMTCVIRMVKYTIRIGALSLERPRPDVGVVDHVRDQEQRRHRERADHRRAMPGNLASPDEVVARQQEQSGDAIERRVEGGEVGQSHAVLDAKCEVLRRSRQGRGLCRSPVTGTSHLALCMAWHFVVAHFESRRTSTMLRHSVTMPNSATTSRHRPSDGSPGRGVGLNT